MMTHLALLCVRSIYKMCICSVMQNRMLVRFRNRIFNISRTGKKNIILGIRSSVISDSSSTPEKLLQFELASKNEQSLRRISCHLRKRVSSFLTMALTFNRHSILLSFLLTISAMMGRAVCTSLKMMDSRACFGAGKLLAD